MSRVFFTDRDLGRRFPEILSAAGLRVERHADHFAPDGSDEEWLEFVGKQEWVAITHDSRIRYKPNELQAVVRHRVALLVMVGKAPFFKLAESFVQTVPRIERFLTKQTVPFIAKVYRPAEKARQASTSGRVELWFPKAPAAR